MSIKNQDKSIKTQGEEVVIMSPNSEWMFRAKKTSSHLTL